MSNIDKWARESQEKKEESLEDRIHDICPSLSPRLIDDTVIYDCPTCEQPTELEDWEDFLDEEEPLDPRFLACGRSPRCIP